MLPNSSYFNNLKQMTLSSLQRNLNNAHKHSVNQGPYYATLCKSYDILSIIFLTSLRRCNSCDVLLKKPQ